MCLWRGEGCMRMQENLKKNSQEKMTMSPHLQGFFGQRNPTILGSV